MTGLVSYWNQSPSWLSSQSSSSEDVLFLLNHSTLSTLTIVLFRKQITGHHFYPFIVTLHSYNLVPVLTYGTLYRSSFKPSFPHQPLFILSLEKKGKKRKKKQVFMLLRNRKEIIISLLFFISSFRLGGVSDI